MTFSNWILLFVLIGLIVVFTTIYLVCRHKIKDYEGFCGFNHGDEDPHKNDHIL